MKIAVVTCYDQNDYIRARGLRTAFQACPGVRTVVIKNRHIGLLRYPEMAVRLLRFAWRERPDAYVVTFRGYELLFLLRLAGVRKPVIFDEMINGIEYFREHGKLHTGTKFDALARRFYRWLVRECRFVLADTAAHAALSAQLTGLPPERFRVLPVAAEETLFFPDAPKTIKASHKSSGPFTVFYYGSMLPLHGLAHVLAAAVLLQDDPRIQFSIVGGKQQAAAACAAAAAQGAHIAYETWVPFDKLPARVHGAGLTLGGPFGKTLQSQYVVTGKTAQFLACAAPVLVGRNKASGEFQDKQNCLLVPPADPAAIAAAVRWAAAHPVELAGIAARGRTLYERSFSQAVVNASVRELVAGLRTAIHSTNDRKGRRHAAD